MANTWILGIQRLDCYQLDPYLVLHRLVYYEPSQLVMDKIRGLSPSIRPDTRPWGVRGRPLSREVSGNGIQDYIYMGAGPSPWKVSDCVVSISPPETMLFYFEARLGRFEYTQHNTVERSFLLLVIQEN